MAASVDRTEPCLCGEPMIPGGTCPDPDCPTRPECPFTSADECAMARERAVAGTDELIAPCAEHDVEIAG